MTGSCPIKKGVSVAGYISQCAQGRIRVRGGGGGGG